MVIFSVKSSLLFFRFVFFFAQNNIWIITLPLFYFKEPTHPLHLCSRNHAWYYSLVSCIRAVALWSLSCPSWRNQATLSCCRQILFTLLWYSSSFAEVQFFAFIHSHNSKFFSLIWFSSSVLEGNSAMVVVTLLTLYYASLDPLASVSWTLSLNSF